MRVGFVQWMAAALLAVLLHAGVLAAWRASIVGDAGAPPGPRVEMAASMASAIGGAAEIDTALEAPRVLAFDHSLDAVTVADPPLEPITLETAELLVDVAPEAAAPPPPLAAIAPAPIPSDLPVIETHEATEEPALLAQPVMTRSKKPSQADVPRVREPRHATTKPNKRSTTAPPRRSKRDGPDERAARRGTSYRQSQSGSQRRSGGGGRQSATPGAIRSFKSQVRARIAACVRSRMGGMGRGRVVIRFAVSAAGRAQAVSASGTGSLTSAADSAARGCSFPKPPGGSGGMRFAFPVSLR